MHSVIWSGVLYRLLQSACHRRPVLLYRYNMLLFAFLDIIYFIPLLFYHIYFSFQADRLSSVILSKIFYLQYLIIIHIVPSYHLFRSLFLSLSLSLLHVCWSFFRRDRPAITSSDQRAWYFTVSDNRPSIILLLLPPYRLSI